MTSAEPSLDAPAQADEIEAARDLTSQRLITAAAEVFAEKGYDRAGVQEIARRAGLTTGAIYGRFTGKAELLLAALEDHTLDELNELFNQHRFDGHASSIIRTVGAHLVTPTDDPAEGALLLEAFVAARRDDDVRRLLVEVLDGRAKLLADLVEVAKADGTIDARYDTESIVTFCHAVGLGFLLFDAVCQPLPEPAPWEHLITRLVAALAPSAPSTANPQGE